MIKNKKYITDKHKEYIRQLIKSNKLNNWELEFFKNIIKYKLYSNKQQQIVHKIFRKNNIDIPKNYSANQIKRIQEIEKISYKKIKFKGFPRWEYKDRYSYRKS